MSEQIKVEFYVHDNFVYGRVLEMPERLRGKLVLTNGKYIVASCVFVDLSETKLFIRGANHSHDNHWFKYEYPNADDANKAVENFQRLIREWNESNRPILDETEKEYLTAVIKPFRGKIDYIKIATVEGGDELWIVSKTRMGNTMCFPTFKSGSIYKGMKRDKQYTLEELGL